MAFNPYFPATYQPYGQGFYQNPYQPQQQTQQNQIQMNGIIWVGSDSEADAYPIAPNNAVTLWNRSAPIVYFKQADASGKPSMKIYDLVERVQNPVERKRQDESSFATKDDVVALEDAIKMIKGELKAIKKDMAGKEVGEDGE